MSIYNFDELLYHKQMRVEYYFQQAVAQVKNAQQHYFSHLTASNHFCLTPVLLLLLLLHLFNDLFSRTTWVSRHQKDKPFWSLLEQDMMGLQWHQLDHMQIICTSLQTDNHASTSPLGFYRTDALPAAQPTASKH